MYYNIISGALVVLGFAVLFFLDTLIAKDTEYSLLRNVRENNLMIGVVCLGAGYYMYTLGQKSPMAIEEFESLETSAPLAREELPSYEEATSTDQIINM
jgi:hypothetical protein